MIDPAQEQGPAHGMLARATTRVTLSSVHFHACSEAHQDRWHEECPDCVLVADRGVIAYYHKNPLRRLLWRWFHKAT